MSLMEFLKGIVLLHTLVVFYSCVLRFLMFVPAATSQLITIHSYHPHPSELQRNREFQINFRTKLLPCFELLHPIVTGGSFLFPERRLIQYDCGKWSSNFSIVNSMDVF